MSSTILAEHQKESFSSLPTITLEKLVRDFLKNGGETGAETLNCDLVNITPVQISDPSSKNSFTIYTQQKDIQDRLESQFNPSTTKYTVIFRNAKLIMKTNVEEYKVTLDLISEPIEIIETQRLEPVNQDLICERQDILEDEELKYMFKVAEKKMNKMRLLDYIIKCPPPEPSSLSLSLSETTRVLMASWMLHPEKNTIPQPKTKSEKGRTKKAVNDDVVIETEEIDLENRKNNSYANRSKQMLIDSDIEEIDAEDIVSNSRSKPSKFTQKWNKQKTSTNKIREKSKQSKLPISENVDLVQEINRSISRETICEEIEEKQAINASTPAFTKINEKKENSNMKDDQNPKEVKDIKETIGERQLTKVKETSKDVKEPKKKELVKSNEVIVTKDIAIAKEIIEQKDTALTKEVRVTKEKSSAKKLKTIKETELKCNKPETILSSLGYFGRYPKSSKLTLIGKRSSPSGSPSFSMESISIYRKALRQKKSKRIEAK